MNTSNFLFAAAMAIAWIIGIVNAIVGIRRKKLNLLVFTFSGKYAVGMGILVLILLLVFLWPIFLGPIASFFINIAIKP